MKNDSCENNKIMEEGLGEPFSDTMESIEYRKEKKIYNICIYFLPILIIILILSIVIYFLLKEPINKNKEKNNAFENEMYNYTIKEKIQVFKNNSNAIVLFHIHFTNLKNENIISIKINNKTIESPQNTYKFNKIGFYQVEITFNKKLTSMKEMFHACENIEELDLSGLDTSGVTTMKSTFDKCYRLKKINFENFNTSLVTDMSNMFSYSYSLTSLNLYNFNTSLVQDMSYMFANCSKLEYINISSFQTHNVYKMIHMFYSCNLSSLDVYNFNTEKVAYMTYMFYNCGVLTSLNLSNFDTREVVNFDGMFMDNKFLQNIDISNFDTNKMNSCTDIFLNLPQNGTLTFNEKISAIILNQIPKNWEKIKSNKK